MGKVSEQTSKLNFNFRSQFIMWINVYEDPIQSLFSQLHLCLPFLVTCFVRVILYLSRPPSCRCSGFGFVKNQSRSHEIAFGSSFSSLLVFDFGSLIGFGFDGIGSVCCSVCCSVESFFEGPLQCCFLPVQLICQFLPFYWILPSGLIGGPEHPLEEINYVHVITKSIKHLQTWDRTSVVIKNHDSKTLRAAITAPVSHKDKTAIMSFIHFICRKWWHSVLTTTTSCHVINLKWRNSSPFPRRYSECVGLNYALSLYDFMFDSNPKRGIRGTLFPILKTKRHWRN